jgi:hypothetical protein
LFIVSHNLVNQYDTHSNALFSHGVCAHTQKAKETAGANTFPAVEKVHSHTFSISCDNDLSDTFHNHSLLANMSAF